MCKRWIVAGTLIVIMMSLFAAPVWADGPTNRTERAEVRFLEGMIDHHAMALDMAHDCLEKAATPSVRDLCQNVITAQSREIEIMRGWLLVWYGIEYQPMSMMGMHHMMQGGMMQGGMMQSAPVDPSLQGTPVPSAPGSQHEQHHPDTVVPAQPVGPTPTEPAGMMGMMGWYSYHLTGVDYEIAWLEAMIDHHDDALHMSQRILGITERPELQALAQGIIDAQTGETEFMEGLLSELGVATS